MTPKPNKPRVIIDYLCGEMEGQREPIDMSVFRRPFSSEVQFRTGASGKEGILSDHTEW